MAPSMRRRKRPDPKQARAALVRELQLQQLDARRAHERELVELMTQINTLLRKERKALPAYERRFRGEDARSAFYFRMLRRVGLPEVHARFAPWFLKSHKLRLGRWSAALFSRLEAAFFAQPERLSTLEQRMRAHQLELLAVMGEAAGAAKGALAPRDKNQTMLRRAFRDCSFHPTDSAKDMEKDSEEEEEEDEDESELERIPEVSMGGRAPPGLAPAVRGTLESLGKHEFFSYMGKWKRGEMVGAMGVYAFADGGKYRGEWQASAPHGAGTVVYPNGVTYTGAFVAGQFHGFGVLEAAAGGGFRYEGEFHRGRRSGRGTLVLRASGATYEGEFYADKRHGIGSETSSLGYVYTGEWRANRLCGKGRLVFPDGKTSVYRADWPPMLLGEAVRAVRQEQRAARERDEAASRRLLRVRDDLRALDLQMAFWDAEEARRTQEEDTRLDRLKQARRDKREAQAAAKRAFLERAQREAEAEREEDDEEEGEEEGDGDEEEEEADKEEEAGD